MDGVPEGGFVLNMKNQDGGWRAEYADLQDRVDNARIVLKIASASNDTPEALTEVKTLDLLREERTENAFYRDNGQGVAYFDQLDGPDDEKVGINTQSTTFRPGETVDATDIQLNGTVFEGEWLEYTTNVEAGTFDLTLYRKPDKNLGRWGSENAGVRVLIGESNSATEFTVLGEVRGAGVAPDGFSRLWILIHRLEAYATRAGITPYLKNRFDGFSICERSKNKR